VIARNAGRSQDLRYDSLCQMQTGGNHIWEIAVPSGPYSVLVAAGDPSSSSGIYRLTAENILLLDGAPSASDLWLEGLGTVVVTDGRLSITSGPGAISNRLAYLEISAIQPATISQWRALFFGATNTFGLAADNADPDGDGVPNLLEYAFGLNPLQFDNLPQLSPVMVQTNNAVAFGCTFWRNTNATDLVFRVQVSDSLTAPVWLDLASYNSASGWNGAGRVWETPSSASALTVTALDPQPILMGTNHFLRLRVEYP
jgi:hypothetical protein